jgi:hypothetical protein
LEANDKKARAMAAEAQHWAYKWVHELLLLLLQV